VDNKTALDLEIVTIAELLQAAGYATGHFGKWHLGGAGHLPTDQGFDVNVAGNELGTPPSYFYPYEGARGQLGDHSFSICHTTRSTRRSVPRMKSSIGFVIKWCGVGTTTQPTLL
jgi:arylsulfatase A-like enzyme